MPDERLFLPSDPNGFYAELGIGPLADQAEIKAAFRRKVKQLHPDFNPAEDAPRRFQALTDAYRVLRDPRRRRRYDAFGAARAPLAALPEIDSAPEPLRCSRCGKTTAQPRYIVFQRVKSFLLRTQRTFIRGIFCRACADRTVVAASTYTWLLGWWGLSGPALAIAALTRNLRGGERPRGDNLRIILHQARAFLALGEAEIAQSLAGQAAGFARTPEERQRVRELSQAAGVPARRLRSRWGRAARIFLIQALPLAALGLALLVVASVAVFRSQTDSVSAAITLHPARAGEVRHVAVELLKLRQGPGAEQPVVALLDRFTTVRVIGSEANGEWAQIVTANGVTGYVPALYLFAGSGDAPKEEWCASHRGDPPRNGDILLRRTGGDHGMTVSNATGMDAVVRLKTPSGQTLLSFFVAAGADAAVTGIPDGTFHTDYASGRAYSRACGVFLKDMRAFALPEAQTFGADAAAQMQLTLLPADTTPGGPLPLPPERFLDN